MSLNLLNNAASISSNKVQRSNPDPRHHLLSTSTIFKTESNKSHQNPISLDLLNIRLGNLLSILPNRLKPLQHNRPQFPLTLRIHLRRHHQLNLSYQAL